MNIKLEREKKLLTQQQLADLVGVDRTLISGSLSNVGV